MKPVFGVAITLALLTPAAARADQCAVVPADTAAAAVKVIKALDNSVTLYCEPCHDAPPSAMPKVKPGKVAAVADKADKTKSHVELDGHGVDLASVYVASGKATLTNVGLMVGCGATGVSGFVTIGTVSAGSGPGPAVDPKLAQLEAELKDVDARTSKAVDAVVAAQNDADRAAAKAKLLQLQREKQELEARIAAAKAEAAKAARDKGRHISQQCLDNPLAKGCN